MTTGKKLSFQIWMLKGESNVEGGSALRGRDTLIGDLPHAPLPLADIDAFVLGN